MPATHYYISFAISFESSSTNPFQFLNLDGPYHSFLFPKFKNAVLVIAAFFKPKNNHGSPRTTYSFWPQEHQGMPNIMEEFIPISKVNRKLMSSSRRPTLALITTQSVRLQDRLPTILLRLNPSAVVASTLKTEVPSL